MSTATEPVNRPALVCRGTRRTRSPWSGMAAVVVTLVAAMTPVFIVAALATPIETAFDLSGTVFGLALSGFYALTALGSPLARRVAAPIPVPGVLATICVIATLALLLAAGNRYTLVAGLLVGGTGNALTQPVAARYIAARVPARRLSLATGLTGAALGAAPLLPGLLAGHVAEPFGWRTALITAAGLTAAAAITVPLARLGPTEATRPAAGHHPASSQPGPGAGRVLLLWTVGAALATVGSSGVASFFVQLGTTSGLSTVIAGTMLSLASVLAVIVRITAGLTADRHPRRNPHVVAVMMLSGVIGLALISLDTPGTFLIGAVLAVAGGWGWTGLLLSAVMRLLPGQAARAGSAVQVGLFGGATLAPITVGGLTAGFGAATAVLVAAAAVLLGTVAIELGARQLPTDATEHP